MIERLIKNELKNSQKSILLLGPRQVGKSTLIAQLKPDLSLNLASEKDFSAYVSNPQELENMIEITEAKSIFIDEIQRWPKLLNTVQALVDKNKKLKFYLTGSSARKLKRGHANLLGGRAWRYEMSPLCSPEILNSKSKNLDLEKVFSSGLLPSHFTSPEPLRDLRSYVADYLKEEIASEALTQNIPAFSNFLKVAAQSSSELINYTNMARDTGVSAKVVRTYFQILEDTLLGDRKSVV